MGAGAPGAGRGGAGSAIEDRTIAEFTLAIGGGAREFAGEAPGAATKPRQKGHVGARSEIRLPHEGQETSMGGQR